MRRRGSGTSREGRNRRSDSSKATRCTSRSGRIPAGQLLGVYRVRGPIDSPGKRSVSGYVKYLIGVIQAVPNVDGQATARVRKSFEDLTRDDLISEEIPAYTPVRIDPGADGIPSSVITGRLENKELAQGDFCLPRPGRVGGRGGG